jgi:hypothetical protein
MTIASTDPRADSAPTTDQADRRDRVRRRADPRQRQARLVDGLLAHLGRPDPDSLDRDAGVIALAFRPADPGAERLEPLGRLGDLRMVCLRHRWDQGRPALPLSVHRFQLDLLAAVVHAPCIAAYDLAAQPEEIEAPRRPKTGPLRAANHLGLATLAAAMRHQVQELGRDPIPDAPRLLPEFLLGFQDRPEPAPLVFEENPTVIDLAIDLRCDIDEVWRRLQVHVLVDRAGRVAELPRGARPPEAHQLPPGTRLYAAWPAQLFTRDDASRHDIHPLDGSPRPPDDATAGAMPAGWFLADGVPLPRAQRPDLVLVRPPTGGPGRLVPNPAWSILRRHGVLGWTGSLRDFRRQHQAGWPAYLRRFATRHPRRLDRLGAEVYHLARAFGLPATRADVRRMIAAPAEPLIVPGRADVQLFRPTAGDGSAPTLAGPGYRFELAGRPHSGPSTPLWSDKSRPADRPSGQDDRAG